MFDPWGAAESLTDWVIHQAPTPRKGLCDWGTRTITIDPKLTQAEQRAVLTHELVHAERGPFPRRLTAREENTVRAIASRRLIELGPLIEAVSWSRIPLVIAQELDVDTDTVHARADNLEESERAQIDARLATLHLP